MRAFKSEILEQLEWWWYRDALAKTARTEFQFTFM
jgi:hypothetical protein